MGIDRRYIGYKPPDDRFKEMLAVYEACEAAGVDLPKEVDDFFEGGEPDELGVEVDLQYLECCTTGYDDDARGITINLEELPEDIKVIRIYDSF